MPDSALTFYTLENEINLPPLLACWRDGCTRRLDQGLGDLAQSLIRKGPMHPIAAAPLERRSILHVCKREMLRPLRDQVLRISGFEVESTCSVTEALTSFWARHYDLILIDVEGEAAIHDAERLCSEIKTAQHGQLVAFVCNWRVAIHTDCPDEILRTEFDPGAFVGGVRKTLHIQ